MLTIGLLGGMSWESSIEYERMINEGVRDSLGGTRSADLVIRSYNFAEIEALQEAGDWAGAGALLAADARSFNQPARKSSCCAPTRCTSWPTASRPRSTSRSSTSPTRPPRPCFDAGVQSVALLGTRYTMEQDFYRGRLEQPDSRSSFPTKHDRTTVHDVIYDELIRGIVRDQSKQSYLDIIGRTIDRGATGVIGGCTEIELLVSAEDLSVPFFPTTQIHAEAAVRAALAG